MIIGLAMFGSFIVGGIFGFIVATLCVAASRYEDEY